MKEFEDAAWALRARQTSDIVRSQFGFHIIRLTGKRAAATRPLERSARRRSRTASDSRRPGPKRPKCCGRCRQGHQDARRPRSCGEGARADRRRLRPVFAARSRSPVLGFAPAVSRRGVQARAGQGERRPSATDQGFAFIAVARNQAVIRAARSMKWLTRCATTSRAQRRSSSPSSGPQCSRRHEGRTSRRRPRPPARR